MYAAQTVPHRCVSCGSPYFYALLRPNVKECGCANGGLTARPVCGNLDLPVRESAPGRATDRTHHPSEMEKSLWNDVSQVC